MLSLVPRMHYLVDFLKQFEALCHGSPQYKQSPSFHLRSFSSCVGGLNLVISTGIGSSNGISLLRALEDIDVVDAIGCRLSMLLLLSCLHKNKRLSHRTACYSF
jgi:hypothetical protein